MLAERSNFVTGQMLQGQLRRGALTSFVSEPPSLGVTDDELESILRQAAEAQSFDSFGSLAEQNGPPSGYVTLVTAQEFSHLARSAPAVINARRAYNDPGTANYIAHLKEQRRAADSARTQAAFMVHQGMQTRMQPTAPSKAWTITAVVIFIPLLLLNPIYRLAKYLHNNSQAASLERTGEGRAKEAARFMRQIDEELQKVYNAHEKRASSFATARRLVSGQLNDPARSVRVAVGAPVLQATEQHLAELEQSARAALIKMFRPYAAAIAEEIGQPSAIGDIAWALADNKDGATAFQIQGLRAETADVINEALAPVYNSGLYAEQVSRPPLVL